MPPFNPRERQADPQPYIEEIQIKPNCQLSSCLNGELVIRLLATKYSWTPLIRTRLFRIPRYFELKTIPPGCSLQSFTIGYFELPLFRTIFRFPCEFEIAGFNCSDISFNVMLQML